MEEVRKEIRILSLHKRAGGLNALDQITIRRYIDASVVLLALVEMNSDENEMSHESDDTEWDLIVAFIMLEVCGMRRERRIERPLSSGEPRTNRQLRQ